LTFQRWEGVCFWVEGGIGKQMWKQRTDTAYDNRQRALPVLERTLTIGELARLVGISAKAIRHYESIGLLPRPARQANGYRRYGMADVNRLRLLHRIRLLGVFLAAAKPLLVDASDARCADVRRELLGLVDKRLAAIDQEIAELRAFRDEVEDYQRALVACCPDEEMLFSQCDDLECIVAPGEVCNQEEHHDVSGIC
jgi:DNA-binding transcriptional MerR regulator